MRLLRLITHPCPVLIAPNFAPRPALALGWSPSHYTPKLGSVQILQSDALATPTTSAIKFLIVHAPCCTITSCKQSSSITALSLSPSATNLHRGRIWENTDCISSSLALWGYCKYSNSYSHTVCHLLTRLIVGRAEYFLCRQPLNTPPGAVSPCDGISFTQFFHL